MKEKFPYLVVVAAIAAIVLIAIYSLPRAPAQEVSGFENIAGAAVAASTSQDIVYTCSDADQSGTANQLTDFTIGMNDYFVVDTRSGPYVLQFIGVETDDRSIVYQAAPSTGITPDPMYVTYGEGNITNPKKAPQGDVIIAGNNFHFWVVNHNSKYRLAVDLNGDGTLKNGGIGC